MGDHLTITTVDRYNVFSDECNVISYYPYYDELVTKLHLQAMTEYQYDILQQRYHQKPQEEQKIHSQTTKKKYS